MTKSVDQIMSEDNKTIISSLKEYHSQLEMYSIKQVISLKSIFETSKNEKMDVYLIQKIQEALIEIDDIFILSKITLKKLSTFFS